ncbi:BZ3500_MvSof-1268-A1-R1_Chr2-1g04269 [Microbotryum saponariae]|uniref:BZ3500_MvSof-1268-A1-R1_Chr2-1g04269 protein n=1 Tax=Microbotryum saponariae TaxID=289078 RepID=A0A2X0MI50_9BASI|nr:BZ3500_MvSof-1268-A1-R1_Chr2-1g04269 [Microbotryum saponariae]SCZ91275.1 BZ3501_MvSof-1269-A2-R1_Chr2-1g03925 [Microbotryum saponariae]
MGRNEDDRMGVIRRPDLSGETWDGNVMQIGAQRRPANNYLRRRSQTKSWAWVCKRLQTS